MQDLSSEFGGRRHGGGSGLPQSSADVQLRTDEFWAVKDVSFELRRGQSLGLIGGNGAGKTTLLRMLNGLIKPDTGRIKIKGTTGALIALGAGFNPVLSGLENIYTSASVYGVSNNKINESIDEIIEFADIREFINSPLQTYSSGMAARLGFAVASQFTPSVLLIDEVLAVGDVNFRGKCMTRIDKLIASGSCIIMVSHNANDILRACKSAILMSKGEAVSQGDTNTTLRLYEKTLYVNSTASEGQNKSGLVTIKLEREHTDVEVRSDNWSNILHLKANETIQDAVLSVFITNNNTDLSVARSEPFVLQKTNVDDPISMKVDLDLSCFNPGTYIVSAGIGKKLNEIGLAPLHRSNVGTINIKHNDNSNTTQGKFIDLPIQLTYGIYPYT